MNPFPSTNASHIIRPATPEDGPMIVSLAVAAELFSADETGMLEAVLANHFAGGDEGDVCVLDIAGEVVAVAYYAPAVAADRVWDLTMIAVHPGRQRQGVGAALLRHVEETLRADGQRLLLVETSGLAQYDKARVFYTKHGFEREARIRDFYVAGDDKIVFRKVL